MIWNDQSTEELLFRVRYATSTAVGSIWTTTGNYIYISPSDKLVASYSPSDVRGYAYVGEAGSGSGIYYVRKYFASSRGGRIVDLKAIRISEMYLIRAEAYAKKATPDVAAGTDDLNTLRTARIDSYTPETFNSASALVDALQ